MLMLDSYSVPIYDVQVDTNLPGCLNADVTKLIALVSPDDNRFVYVAAPKEGQTFRNNLFFNCTNGRFWKHVYPILCANGCIGWDHNVCGKSFKKTSSDNLDKRSNN